MSPSLQSIENQFEQNELLRQVLLILFLIVVVVILVHVTHGIVKRFVKDPDRLYRLFRTIRGVGALIALVLVVLVFAPELGDLLTVLTVIGAGLAIAMREVILSLAGWMRINTMTSYRLGDRIEINGLCGDVIDIRMLRTSVMEIRGWVDADQSTGRIVHFPNAWIFNYAVFNYTRGFRFIWNELPVTVTFRSNWQAAHDILLDLGNISAGIIEKQATDEIHAMSSEFLIHYSILTPFVYVRIKDNGIQLTLRYLCEAQKRRGSEHALAVSILDEFKRRDDIELAYPMLGISMPDTPLYGAVPGSGEKA